MTRALKLLPWIFFAAFAGLLLVDSRSWHPGFSFLDEGVSVAHVQLWREGTRLPFVLFSGCIYRILAAYFVAGFGWSLESWRGFSLLVLGLESLMLYRLACRLAGENAGERAGIWAVCFNLATALTFLRGRSLLSYTLLPLELSLLLWLLPYARGPWKAVLWGTLPGLLLADYEGWSFALPVLAWCWFAAPEEERPGFWPALLGFALMALVVAWASRNSLHGYVEQRQRSLAHGSGLLSVLRLSLKSFFWGGETYGYMGVAGHSVFPLWALPALGAGAALAWKRGRWILGWVLLGLLPMALIGTAAEPNRLMPAWPALCLLTGMGLARLPQRLAWLPLPLLLLGAAFEAKAYAASMQGQYAKYYSESAELLTISRQAKEAYPKGASLISELDYESAASARFIWHAYGPQPGAKVLALVPQEYAISLDPHWGNQAQLQHYVLLEPEAKAAQRLLGIQTELLALRKSLPPFEHLARRSGELAYLKDHPQADPWVRTSVMESALGLSFTIGDLPKELLESILKEKLSSASAYVWLAAKAKTSDPGFAKYLCERATRKDPRLKRSPPCGPAPQAASAR